MDEGDQRPTTENHPIVEGTTSLETWDYFECLNLIK